MKNEIKSKAYVVYLIIFILFMLYILSLFIFNTSYNLIITESEINQSNSNNTLQTVTDRGSTTENAITAKSFIAEQDLTYLGAGDIKTGTFPSYNYYIGYENYVGTQPSTYNINFKTNYFIKITSGSLNGEIRKLTSWYPSFSILSGFFNDTEYYAIEGESFELYEVQTEQNDFKGIVTDTHIGEKQPEIPTVRADKQIPLLLWDGKGGFFAGSHYTNSGSRSTWIGDNAVGIGVGSPLGEYSVSINGESNNFASIAIGGQSDGDRAIAIGLTSWAISDRTTAIGANSQVKSESGVAIGDRAIDYSTGSFNTIIGGLNTISSFGSTDINNYNMIIGAYGKIGSNHNSTGLFHLPTTASYKTYNVDESFLFSIGGNDNLQIENNEGVRVGALTGESITMSGDELYVKGNQEIDGFLVLGSNAETGLGAGDINASTIYYDTLTAKSPIFLCSYHELKCFVIDTEAEKEYYVTIDKDYNILSSRNKDSKKSETVTKKVKDKFDKLKQKKIETDSIKEFVDSCVGQIEGNQCVTYTTQSVSREQATQTTQQPIMKTKTIEATKLNETLHEVTYKKTILVESGETETVTKLKDNCSWNEENGFSCTSRNILSNI